MVIKESTQIVRSHISLLAMVYRGTFAPAFYRPNRMCFSITHAHSLYI